jgi:hypothetical protein
MFRRLFVHATLCAGLILAAPAGADGLLDKIKQGTAKVGESAGEVANKAGETINSTIDLVTEDGTPAELREEIDIMSADTFERAFSENSDIQTLFDQSAGYAVFDARNINWGLAAGYGRGVAVSKSTGDRIYMRMGTGGVGLSFGFGGFANKVVILFETDSGFSDFVVNGYDGTAGASTMVVDQKSEETIRFYNGRSVFVFTDKGLKVSASAVGTKYWADDKLNQ